jgi:hypothetical protein
MLAERKSMTLPAHPKSPERHSSSPEARWAVARIFSKRVGRIIDEAGSIGGLT